MRGLSRPRVPRRHGAPLRRAGGTVADRVPAVGIQALAPDIPDRDQPLATPPRWGRLHRHGPKPAELTTIGDTTMHTRTALFVGLLMVALPCAGQDPQPPKPDEDPRLAAGLSVAKELILKHAHAPQNTQIAEQVQVDVGQLSVPHPVFRFDLTHPVKTGDTVKLQDGTILTFGIVSGIVNGPNQLGKKMAETWKAVVVHDGGDEWQGLGVALPGLQPGLERFFPADAELWARCWKAWADPRLVAAMEFARQHVVPNLIWKQQAAIAAPQLINDPVQFTVPVEDGAEATLDVRTGDRVTLRDGTELELAIVMGNWRALGAGNNPLAGRWHVVAQRDKAGVQNLLFVLVDNVQVFQDPSWAKVRERLLRLKVLKKCHDQGRAAADPKIRQWTNNKTLGTAPQNLIDIQADKVVAALKPVKDGPPDEPRYSDPEERQVFRDGFLEAFKEAQAALKKAPMQPMK